MSITPYLSQDQLQKRIATLAHEINLDYRGEEVVVVGVLNGAFMFVADLIRGLKLPIELEFIGASSYGAGTKSSGEVKISLDLKKDIRGRNVLLVEDIVDTGLTINNILGLLKARGPKSIKLAALLYKPARIIHKVPIDYLAFEIEDKFVVGYGLDFDGRFRELPYIGIYQEN